jgi:hypothetical protein
VLSVLFLAHGGAAVLVIGWGWWYDDIIKSPTRSNSFFLFFIFWAGTQGFKKISKVAGGEISIFSISTLSWNLFNFIFSLCFLSEINTLSVSVDHGRSI